MKGLRPWSNQVVVPRISGAPLWRISRAPCLHPAGGMSMMTSCVFDGGSSDPVRPWALRWRGWPVAGSCLVRGGERRERGRGGEGERGRGG